MNGDIEENPKHGEAMGQPTENAAFSAGDDQQAPPPSYDESKEMPIAGEEIRGTLPPVDPVPMAPAPATVMTTAPTAPTAQPVIVMAPNPQQVNPALNPYFLGRYPVMVTCPQCHQSVSNMT